jgi:hypothetical protein
MRTPCDVAKLSLNAAKHLVWFEAKEAFNGRTRWYGLTIENVFQGKFYAMSPIAEAYHYSPVEEW